MIEFISDEHIYLVEGIIVPSVTTILKETLFTSQYEGVSEYTLQKASEFGNAVHKAIETQSSDGLTFTQNLSYDQYLRLKDLWQFEPLEQEKIVHSKLGYIGTLDMVAKFNGLDVIMDIKTTYALNEDYLSWQMSMYKYAYEEQGGSLHKAYCLWLPKGRAGELIEIELKEYDQIVELMEQYKEITNKR